MILRLKQISLFLFLSILIYFFAIPLFEFQTYSPDTIRFLHFWQNSFSNLNVEKSNTFLINFYNALQASNYYDLGRGRIVLYLIYGLENISLYFSEILPKNFLMILLVLINSHAVAIISSKNISNSNFYIYSLIFVIISLNAISLSPIMYFPLYAKYICITFILYFFIFQNSFFKVLMLLLASFSDEIGLFLSLIISFFYFIKYFYIKFELGDNQIRKLIKSIIYSGVICLFFLASFFAIIAITFDSIPFQFPKYAARSAIWLLDPVNLFNKVLQLGWTLEILILGASVEKVLTSAFIGFSFIILMIIFLFRGNAVFNLDFDLSKINMESTKYLIIFWALASLILFIVLPASQYAYQTYAYPIMLSISLAIFLVMSLKIKPKNYLKLLIIITCMHFLTIPSMAVNINQSNTQHLLKDSSISSSDILDLHQAVDSIRINQNYIPFKAINNSQEIDFSGKWYYSNIKHFRFSYKVDEFGNQIETDKYYPVYGNTRVLSWPHFDAQKAGLHEREFSKNQPSYRN